MKKKPEKKCPVCEDEDLVYMKDEVGAVYFCKNVRCQGGSLGPGQFRLTRFNVEKDILNAD